MVRNVDTDVRLQLIHLPAHLAQGSLASLDRQVDQAIVAKTEVVGLEMSGVQTLDSAALNWLLTVQNRLAAQGIQMQLQHPSILCSDIFVATRLDHRFKIVAMATQDGEVRHG